MNETQAQQVLLARALESDAAALSDEDRRHASRAALELARWQADERKSALSPDEFLARRAGLLVEKIGPRQPALLRAARLMQWPGWLAVVLPLAALLLGALSEQVHDRSRVNLLAFPLLVIVLWNLAVYALLMVRAVSRKPALPALSRWMASRAARVSVGSAAATSFANDWLRRSAPLTGARIARVLHLSAALFALGAVAALYLRGLVFEYRVGWESTFLDASHVHAWLSTLLAPASVVSGLASPTLAEVESLRFSAGAPGGAAARWIHLSAITVALLVIVPRLLLAAWARWRERRLSARFPLDLNEPYFRRLLAHLAPRAARVRVLPYSYTPDEASIEGLQRLARALCGDEAELALRPGIAFGDEARAAESVRADETVTLNFVLVSLAATPEHENHGALLEGLGKALARAPGLLVDEAPYRRRLGAGGEARLAERRDAWRAFSQAHGVTMTAIDLSATDLAPQLPQAERDLAPLLGAPA